MVLRILFSNSAIKRGWYMNRLRTQINEVKPHTDKKCNIEEEKERHPTDEDRKGKTARTKSASRHRKVLHVYFVQIKPRLLQQLPCSYTYSFGEDSS